MPSKMCLNCRNLVIYNNDDELINHFKNCKENKEPKLFQNDMLRNNLLKELGDNAEKVVSALFYINNKNDLYNPSVLEVKKRLSVVKGLSKSNLTKSTKSELKNWMFDKKISHKGAETFYENLRCTSIKKSGFISYYRKVSGGEYKEIIKLNNPFKPAFTYTNTKLYRLWITTSLKKCKKFKNDKSSDNDSKIIEITFKQSLTNCFKNIIKPHQMEGVQGDNKKVALHREGFAELYPIKDQNTVNEIIANKLDHNLGFTQSHYDELKKAYLSFKPVE